MKILLTLFLLTGHSICSAQNWGNWIDVGKGVQVSYKFGTKPCVGMNTYARIRNTSQTTYSQIRIEFDKNCGDGTAAVSAYDLGPGQINESSGNWYATALKVSNFKLTHLTDINRKSLLGASNTGGTGNTNEQIAARQREEQRKKDEIAAEKAEQGQAELVRQRQVERDRQDRLAQVEQQRQIKQQQQRNEADRQLARIKERTDTRIAANQQISNAVGDMAQTLFGAIQDGKRQKEERLANAERRMRGDEEEERILEEERRVLSAEKQRSKNLRNGVFTQVSADGNSVIGMIPETSEEEDLLMANQGQLRAQVAMGDRNFHWKTVRNDDGTTTYYTPKDPSEALKWYTLAAEQGSETAQYKVGWIYENWCDFEIKEDNCVDKAVFWYKKAADNGSISAKDALGNLMERTGNYSEAFATYSKPRAEDGYISGEAMLGLGFLYEKGLGVEQDYAKAMECYQKADKYSYETFFHIGLMFEKGLGVPQNSEIAFKWFEKGLKGLEENRKYCLLFDCGYARQNLLGYMYEMGYGTQKNAVRSAALYEMANKLVTDVWSNKLGYSTLFLSAERGIPAAQYQLALLYQNGNKAISKNSTSAVEWFLRAAEQGHVEAQGYVGYKYHNGDGVKQDYKLAVNWYRKATEAGNTYAMTNLGLCYENGLGVTKSLNEAVNWYRKAAEAGNTGAMKNLGICYENGQGVIKNLTEAVNWYRKAAEVGNTDAMHALGECYANGLGVLENFTEAISWYRKAAEQGNITAMATLGAIYQIGIGVTKNSVESFNWYRKATDRGNTDVMYILGSCYEDGEGVTKNLVEAVIWYRKAAEAGNINAMKSLGNCYSNGIGVKKDINQAKVWYKKANTAK